MYVRDLSRRNVASAAMLLACAALCVWILFLREERVVVQVVRFSTFNSAMHRPEAGQLLRELRDGSEQAARIAEIVQRARADVLLLCEIDRDEGGEAARVFAERYLAVPQNDATAIDFPYICFREVNTGVPSGRDLDEDGETGGAGDALGYGAHPGQYGMALFSRYPIVEDRIRTFRRLLWKDMPDNRLPGDFYDEQDRNVLPLSSKSHWDVPVQLTEDGMIVHALCSHPTPPVFDGEEDRNGRRNADEIRFWADYVTPGQGDWIVDDRGRRGGLPEGEHFVVLGDLNADPADGDSLPGAIGQLLDHPRIRDPQPGSEGGVEQKNKQWGANATHEGDPALDTGDFADRPGEGPGNLRLDYVLPSRSLDVARAGVFWPRSTDPHFPLLTASDHRLVWADLIVD